MLFNSIEFLLFFPIVVSIYFLLPFKYRWFFLLVASYLFYGLTNGKLLLLIALSTLIDYLVGIAMEGKSSKKERKPFLIISLVSNLLILCTFKYYNFFHDSFVDFLSIFGLKETFLPISSLILPVGISFYTFQTIGYSVDVYKGKVKAERHIGYFALYVTYFPQLVAGPIERSSSLIPQLKKEYKVKYDRITSGLKLMLWGFFKKIVIADQIAPLIDYVKVNPGEFYGLSVLLCACLFAYQIYCDFSGYSDIAIGGARVMGVNLIQNFKRPFKAKSLSELWNRWHVSLINWFKDYIYIPLGGSRNGRFVAYRNVLIVFLISGLWHGANYNFIIWGFLNGFFILISLYFKDIKSGINLLMGRSKFFSLYRGFLTIKSFLLFSILLIFFFSKNLSDSLILYNNLFSNWLVGINDIVLNDNNSRTHDLYLGSSFLEFSIIIVAIVFMELVQFQQEKNNGFIHVWSKKPVLVRWSGYLGLTFLIILFSFDKEVPFYYFQF